jgi:hypothetical protein
MTLSTNDDFANRELSFEECETVAGGLMTGVDTGFRRPHPPRPQPRLNAAEIAAEVAHLMPIVPLFFGAL